MHKRLKKLIDNNILVYDETAALGEFTSKLVSLMNEIYKNGNLTYFLLDKELYFSNIGEIKILANLGIRIYYYIDDYKSIYINYGGTFAGEFTHSLYNQSNTNIHQDKHLIIGWDIKNKNGIIGSC